MEFFCLTKRSRPHRGITFKSYIAHTKNSFFWSFFVNQKVETPSRDTFKSYIAHRKLSHKSFFVNQKVEAPSRDNIQVLYRPQTAFLNGIGAFIHSYGGHPPFLFMQWKNKFFVLSIRVVGYSGFTDEYYFV